MYALYSFAEALGGGGGSERLLTSEIIFPLCITVDTDISVLVLGNGVILIIAF